MSHDCQNMTMEELVDILAQKTQQFTQLLVYKDFGKEYKECKDAIQQLLLEIEKRKEKAEVENKSQLGQPDPA
jgi:spore maturation protein CgeB